MKSAVVVLVLALMVSVCNASDAGNELTNGQEDSVTKVSLDDTTVTNEDATAENVSEDESTVPNTPSVDSTNETVTTTVLPVTSAPTVTQKVSSAPTVNQTVATTPSANQTTPSGGTKRLSTEIDKSKCESLGLEIPKAADCKCYKQKSAGTDTPHGFCYYYECAGNPPALSKHKCEWIKE